MVRFFTKIQIQIFKSENGYFVSLTRLQKRIIDPNDPQQRWILSILSKHVYFGCVIRSVSLPRIQKGWK